MRDLAVSSAHSGTPLRARCQACSLRPPVLKYRGAWLCHSCRMAFFNLSKKVQQFQCVQTQECAVPLRGLPQCKACQLTYFQSLGLVRRGCASSIASTKHEKMTVSLDNDGHRKITVAEDKTVKDNSVARVSPQESLVGRNVICDQESFPANVSCSTFVPKNERLEEKIPSLRRHSQRHIDNSDKVIKGCDSINRDCFVSELPACNSLAEKPARQKHFIDRTHPLIAAVRSCDQTVGKTSDATHKSGKSNHAIQTSDCNTNVHNLSDKQHSSVRNLNCFYAVAKFVTLENGRANAQQIVDFEKSLSLCSSADRKLPSRILGVLPVEKTSEKRTLFLTRNKPSKGTHLCQTETAVRSITLLDAACSQTCSVPECKISDSETFEVQSVPQHDNPPLKKQLRDVTLSTENDHVPTKCLNQSIWTTIINDLVEDEEAEGKVQFIQESMQNKVQAEVALSVDLSVDDGNISADRKSENSDCSSMVYGYARVDKTSSSQSIPNFTSSSMPLNKKIKGKRISSVKAKCRLKDITASVADLSEVGKKCTIDKNTKSTLCSELPSENRKSKTRIIPQERKVSVSTTQRNDGSSSSVIDYTTTESIVISPCGAVGKKAKVPGRGLPSKVINDRRRSARINTSVLSDINILSDQSYSSNASGTMPEKENKSKKIRHTSKQQGIKDISLVDLDNNSQIFRPKTKKKPLQTQDPTQDSLGESKTIDPSSDSTLPTDVSTVERKSNAEPAWLRTNKKTTPTSISTIDGNVSDFGQTVSCIKTRQSCRAQSFNPSLGIKQKSSDLSSSKALAEGVKHKSGADSFVSMPNEVVVLSRLPLECEEIKMAHTCQSPRKKCNLSFRAPRKNRKQSCKHISKQLITRTISNIEDEEGQLEDTEILTHSVNTTADISFGVETSDQLIENDMARNNNFSNLQNLTPASSIASEEEKFGKCAGVPVKSPKQARSSSFCNKMTDKITERVNIESIQFSSQQVPTGICSSFLGRVKPQLPNETSTALKTPHESLFNDEIAHQMAASKRIVRHASPSLKKKLKVNIPIQVSDTADSCVLLNDRWTKEKKKLSPLSEFPSAPVSAGAEQAELIRSCILDPDAHALIPDSSCAIFKSRLKNDGCEDDAFPCKTITHTNKCESLVTDSVVCMANVSLCQNAAEEATVFCNSSCNSCGVACCKPENVDSENAGGKDIVTQSPVKAHTPTDPSALPSLSSGPDLLSIHCTKSELPRTFSPLTGSVFQNEASPEVYIEPTTPETAAEQSLRSSCQAVHNGETVDNWRVLPETPSSQLPIHCLNTVCVGDMNINKENSLNQAAETSLNKSGMNLHHEVYNNSSSLWRVKTGDIVKTNDAVSLSFAKVLPPEILPVRVPKSHMYSNSENVVSHMGREILAATGDNQFKQLPTPQKKDGVFSSMAKGELNLSTIIVTDKKLVWKPMVLLSRITSEEVLRYPKPQRTCREDRCSTGDQIINESDKKHTREALPIVLKESTISAENRSRLSEKSQIVSLEEEAGLLNEIRSQENCCSENNTKKKDDLDLYTNAWQRTVDPHLDCLTGLDRQSGHLKKQGGCESDSTSCTSALTLTSKANARMTCSLSSLQEHNMSWNVGQMELDCLPTATDGDPLDYEPDPTEPMLIPSLPFENDHRLDRNDLVAEPASFSHNLDKWKSNIPVGREGDTCLPGPALYEDPPVTILNSKVYELPCVGEQREVQNICENTCIEGAPLSRNPDAPDSSDSESDTLSLHASPLSSLEDEVPLPRSLKKKNRFSQEKTAELTKLLVATSDSLDMQKDDQQDISMKPLAKCKLPSGRKSVSCISDQLAESSNVTVSNPEVAEHIITKNEQQLDSDQNYPASSEYCSHFLKNGECHTSGCVYKHLKPKSFQYPMKASEVQESLVPEPEVKILEKISKLCEEGILNRAFEEFEASHMFCTPNCIKKILHCLLTASVKLNQFHRLKTVASFVEKSHLVEWKFCTDLILICRDNAEAARDGLWALFQLCDRNVRLSDRAVAVLVSSHFQDSSSDWRRLLRIIAYSFNFCGYGIPINILGKALQEIRSHPQNAQILAQLVLRLDQKSFLDLGVANIENFIQLLEQYQHHDEADALRHEREIFGTQSLKQIPLTVPSGAGGSLNGLVNSEILQSFPKCIMSNIWDPVIATFCEHGVTKNDFSVLHAIHVALLKKPDMIGEKFRTFVTRVLESGPQFMIKKNYLMGHIGTLLMLEAHDVKNFKCAYQILEAMHHYSINYYHKNLHHTVGAVSGNLGIPPWIIVTPSRVALVALDVCLELKKNIEAVQVLVDCDWGIPATSLPAEIRNQQLALRARLFIQLAKNLQSEENLTDGTDVMKHLLQTFVTDITEFPDREPLAKEVNIIYNNYMVMLLNESTVDEALLLYDFYGKLGAFLDLEENVLRALLISCMVSKKEAAARDIFQQCCLMGIYKVQEPSAVPPRLLWIQSYLAQEELQLLLENFFSRLFFLLHKPRSMQCFEDRFGLTICIEETRTEGANSLQILSNISTSSDSAMLRIIAVLQNHMKPPLTTKPCSQQNRLKVDPLHLQSHIREYNNKPAWFLLPSQREQLKSLFPSSHIARGSKGFISKSSHKQPVFGSSTVEIQQNRWSLVPTPVTPLTNSSDCSRLSSQSYPADSFLPAKTDQCPVLQSCNKRRVTVASESWKQKNSAYPWQALQVSKLPNCDITPAVSSLSSSQVQKRSNGCRSNKKQFSPGRKVILTKPLYPHIFYDNSTAEGFEVQGEVQSGPVDNQRQQAQLNSDDCMEESSGWAIPASTQCSSLSEKFTFSQVHSGRSASVAKDATALKVTCVTAGDQTNSKVVQLLNRPRNLESFSWQDTAVSSADAHIAVQLAEDSTASLSRLNRWSNTPTSSRWPPTARYGAKNFSHQSVEDSTVIVPRINHWKKSARSCPQPSPARVRARKFSELAKRHLMRDTPQISTAGIIPFPKNLVGQVSVKNPIAPLADFNPREQPTYNKVLHYLTSELLRRQKGSLSESEMETTAASLASSFLLEERSRSNQRIISLDKSMMKRLTNYARLSIPHNNP